MRKLSSLLAIATLFVLILTSNVFSYDCAPYCPDSTVKTATYIHLDCEITVTYRVCQTGPSAGHVEILGISWNGVSCGIIPDQTKMDYALRQVLWQSFEDLGYPSPSWTYDVYFPACWENSGTSLSRTNCPKDKCCTQHIH